MSILHSESPPMHSLATRTCSVPFTHMHHRGNSSLPTTCICPSVPLLMCPLLSRVPLVSSSVLPRPKSYEFPTSKSLHYCPLDRYVSSSHLPPSQYSCSLPDTTLYHVSFFICLPSLAVFFVYHCSSHSPVPQWMSNKWSKSTLWVPDTADHHSVYQGTTIYQWMVGSSVIQINRCLLAHQIL